MNRFYSRILLPFFLTCSVMITSCLTLPLSRNFSKYTGNFFGNSNLLERFGNFVVMCLTAPILMVAVIVDIPLSVIHFWTGKQPIMKDPLISSLNQTGWFPGQSLDEKWYASVSEDRKKMELIRFEDGIGKDFYELTRDENDMVQLNKVAILSPKIVKSSDFY